MPPTPQRIGRYDIVNRLGAGGMGVVYLARDPQLDRMVAIKVLPERSEAERDEEVRHRFAREARAVAALRHPHIVTIYDVGEDHGQPFIAMEYLDGESMARAIERRAPLELTDKVRLMLELCAGLAHAHAHGIVHRDIKPANLVLTRDGPLKILDFGIARLSTGTASSELTQVGTVVGTPRYMSPEQMMGLATDHRSDIFSAGTVFYELLTYRDAFAADTPQTVWQRVLHGEPTPMRDIVPAIGPELEQVVARALEKDRERRYQSMEAVAADLRRIMVPAGRPERMDTTRLVAANPEAALERPVPAGVTSSDLSTTRLPARPRTPQARRRALVGAAAVLAVAAAVIAYFVWRARGQGDHRDDSATVQAPATTGNPASGVPSSSSAAQAVGTPNETTKPAEPPPMPAGTRTPAHPQPETRSQKPVETPGTALPRSDPAVAARCTQLTERASLGEALTLTEKTFLIEKCRN